MALPLTLKERFLLPRLMRATTQMVVLGTQKHGLKELENRAFLNQITQLRFKKGKP